MKSGGSSQKLLQWKSFYDGPNRVNFNVGGGKSCRAEEEGQGK